MHAPWLDMEKARHWAQGTGLALLWPPSQGTCAWTAMKPASGTCPPGWEGPALQCAVSLH